MLLDQALFGAAYPAATVAVIALLLRRAARRSRRAPGEGAVLAIAIAAGYVVGHLGLLGWPRWLPTGAVDWLPWIAIAAGGLALFIALRPPLVVGWSVRVVLAAAASWLLLRPVTDYFEWSVAALAMRVAAITAAIFIFLLMLDWIVCRAPRVVAPLVTGLLIAASAVVVTLSGIAKLGQVAGALAVCVAAALGLMLWFRDRPDKPGGSLAYGPATNIVSGLLLAAMWTIGYYNADAPGFSILLLAAAPLGYVFTLALRRRLPVAAVHVIGLLTAVGLPAAAILVVYMKLHG
jgi:hypothetical protein